MHDCPSCGYGSRSESMDYCAWCGVRIGRVSVAVPTRTGVQVVCSEICMQDLLAKVD